MSYPNGPLVQKGALIYFGAPMLVPVANVIAFQYNPKSLTRTLTPWQPPALVPEKDKRGNDTSKELLYAYDDTLATLSQPYDPAETFTLELEMDATDALESPELHPVAAATGIADRIAAIEMLLYPPGDSLLGGLLGTVTGSVSFAAEARALSGNALTDNLDAKPVPIVLFSWGPGRIVPVRITSLSIEESQYSPMLYPIHAKATVGLRVLDLDDLVRVTGAREKEGAAALARAAYLYTRAQKEALATANLLHSAGSMVNT